MVGEWLENGWRTVREWLENSWRMVREWLEAGWRTDEESSGNDKRMALYD